MSKFPRILTLLALSGVLATAVACTPPAAHADTFILDITNVGNDNALTAGQTETVDISGAGITGTEQFYQLTQNANGTTTLDFTSDLTADTAGTPTTVTGGQNFQTTITEATFPQDLTLTASDSNGSVFFNSDPNQSSDTVTVPDATLQTVSLDDSTVGSVGQFNVKTILPEPSLYVSLAGMLGGLMWRRRSTPSA